MDMRTLGRTGLQVSVLGFGAAEIGLQHIARQDADVLLNAVLDHGINVIDTAECYHESEELIGACLGGRRSEFSLFTKCGHADDIESHWQKKTIREGLERSLKRLKTDRVDLLQLHSCPFDLLRQGDVITWLEELKAEGKTRFIGCSADGGAAEFAIATGRFDTIQTSFSIADQELIDRNIAPAQERNMGVIVKRPIANAVWRHKDRPDDPWLHAYWDRLSELRYPFFDMAPAAVLEAALRFALTPDAVGTIIVGTVNAAHLAANISVAQKGPLDPDAFVAIRRRWFECDGARWPGKG